MSDTSQGEGWWKASDEKWYPPHLHPDVLSRQPPPPANWSTDATSEVESPAQRWDNPVNPQPGGSAIAAATTAEVPQAFEQVTVPEPKRGFAKILPFALVSLVVLGGLGFLVASFLGRDDNSTLGGSSPEAAFDQMMAAMADEDVVGLVSMLDPVESAGMLEALRALESDGADLRGLPGGLDLLVTGVDVDRPTAEFSPLGGEDSGLVVAEMDGVTLTLTRAGDDDAAWLVDFGGQLIALSIDEIEVGSEVSVELTPVSGGVETRASGRINGERLGTVADFVEDVPMEMVFIEDDGRWYMSLSYSITNMIVTALDVDEPDYGRWRRVLDSGTAGGATPVEAVDAMVRAAADLDLEGAVNAMDPIELRLLYDFWPTIEREIADDLEAARDEVTIDVIELSLTSEEVSADTAHVTVDRVVVEMTGEGPDEFLRFEGSGDWCGSFEVPDEKVEGCLRDLLEDAQSDFSREIAEMDLDLDLRDLLPDAPILVTTEREGRWYVSPLATFTEYGRQLGPVFEDAAAELQGQMGDVGDVGAGLLPAEQIAYDGDTVVEIPAGETAAFVITPAIDGFESAGFMGEMSFESVEVETTGDARLRHDIEFYWDDLADDSVRISEGEPASLVVAATLRGGTRSHGFVVENISLETITVTVRAAHLEVLEPRNGVATGTLGDHPTVIVNDSGFFDGASSGVELIVPGGERSPWVDLADASSGDGYTPFAIVVGDPGDTFEVEVD